MTDFGGIGGSAFSCNVSHVGTAFRLIDNWRARKPDVGTMLSEEGNIGGGIGRAAAATLGTDFLESKGPRDGAEYPLLGGR